MKGGFQLASHAQGDQNEGNCGIFLLNFCKQIDR